jgi:toxin ParE1/3/4
MRRVLFSPEAESDLLHLYAYIADQSGHERAFAYTDRIMQHCMGFGAFPERGRPRENLRPGLRVTGFERRVAIAFHVTAETVIIDRILYGGRDLASALGSEN